jgi:membrane-bound metal-dependent hydrolase YbcI (DUF457 family)
MLAGHLAVALAARRIEPRLPLAAAVGAAFWLDLVWPVMLLAGLETVRIDPGNTAFTNLAFESYPWTHSLAAALVWSIAGAAAWRAGAHPLRAAVAAGTLVLSHWLLDFVTHRPDLPLWPSGPVVGLRLWDSIPGTILVEGGLFAAGIVVYTRATRPRSRAGTLALAGLVALVGLLWLSQPWSPPPPAPTAVALGALTLWLMIPWAQWIERHRTARSG